MIDTKNICKSFSVAELKSSKFSTLINNKEINLPSLSKLCPVISK